MVVPVNVLLENVSLPLGAWFAKCIKKQTTYIYNFMTLIKPAKFRVIALLSFFVNLTCYIDKLLCMHVPSIFWYIKLLNTLQEVGAGEENGHQ